VNTVYTTRAPIKIIETRDLYTVTAIGVFQWRWPVPPQAGLLFGAMPKSKLRKKLFYKLQLI